MQLSKIEKRLKKIAGLVEMFKVDGKLSQIEKDLLLDYIRKLYEDILKDDLVSDSIAPKQVDQKEKEVKAVISESIEKVREVELPEIKTENVSEQKVVTMAAPAEPAKQETVAANSAYNELFVFDEVKDVSDRLSLSKISNLNKAIGINEKIFTVKELFGGDNDVYKSTINALNDMSSMKEAQRYLSEHIIPKYGWIDDEKYKKAHNFLKTVRRLYV